ncbi:MAG: hypothetical protein DSY43_03090 [Gammaproteobacteria bacterium]|nr:MAG: hypothetical protein DSY43_03090 [Gammaproteobacteria bacterium]
MKIDYDKHLILILSMVVILITVGFSLVVSFLYVLVIAKSKDYCISDTGVLLVLGKKLDNDIPDAEYRSRLKRASWMLGKNSDSNVYILGGMTNNANITESEAGKKVLKDLGVEDNRIFLEQESKHTLENLKNFYGLYSNKSQQVLLITNRYHMARAIMMAKGFKINALSCSAEDAFKYTLPCMGKIIIEAFFINFYLVGKYWAMLTNNSIIINRISTP